MGLGDVGDIGPRFEGGACQFSDEPHQYIYIQAGARKDSSAFNAQHCMSECDKPGAHPT